MFKQPHGSTTTESKQAQTYKCILVSLLFPKVSWQALYMYVGSIYTSLHDIQLASWVVVLLPPNIGIGTKVINKCVYIYIYVKCDIIKLNYITIIINFHFFPSPNMGRPTKSCFCVHTHTRTRARLLQRCLMCSTMVNIYLFVH